MGVIWTKRERKRQPQGVISQNNSQNSSPAFLWSATNLYADVITGQRSSLPISAFSAVGTPFGIAGRNTGPNSPRFDATKFKSSTEYTLLVYLLDDTGRGTLRNFFDSDRDGVSRFFQFRLTASNTVQFIPFNTASTPAVFSTTTTTSSTRPHVIAARVSGNFTADIFIDGGSKTTDTSLAGTTPQTNARAGSEFVIGEYASGGSVFGGSLFWAAYFPRALSDVEIISFSASPWKIFDLESYKIPFNAAAGGSNNTGTLSSTLDAATLTGVGNVTRSGTLAVTLDAATLAGIGGVTRSGTLSSTLDAATLSGAGTVAVGTNRDGTLASTLADVTLTGVGAVTRSGTLSVTLDAATLAGIGTAGQPRTGTLAVTLDNATLSGVGAIPAAPSTGGGKTTGKNLSRKQKKKLKAVESQEWLKAEETARQLLSDRFTKQTPQEKAEALQTYVESLQPVIEALKALTVPEVEIPEEPIIELTPHQEILTRFDTLEKKLKSVEELVIILMADL